MQVEFLPPPRPSRPLPSTARRAAAAGAVVFLLPWDHERRVDDPARSAPRLGAPAPAVSDLEVRTRAPRTEPRASAWVHQALSPLPTEGFLALRAATAAYRKGP